MNLVLIGPVYPLRGGIAHSTALLAQYLSRRHTVSVISYKRQYPSILFPGTTQFESQGDAIPVPAVHEIDSINPLTWRRVGKRLRALAPDCVIVKYWMPFFAPCVATIARMARRNGRTKILFVCDNIMPHERRPGDMLLTRMAFAAADAAIVQSGAVEQELLEVTHRVPYRHVPHPVYESFGAPVPKDEARKKLKLADVRIIHFFGFIRAYKGLKVLLEAMPEVLRSVPVRLLIAGEFYEGEKEYRELIARLKLENAVTIVSEYIPRPEVPFYFSAADVVVLPYNSATQSGIAQIAYNFDKPVITTRVGGLGEVVDDGRTGTIVAPGDPPALARAIVEFYVSRREEEFVANVRTWKRRFSWEAMVDAVEDLLGAAGARQS